MKKEEIFFCVRRFSLEASLSRRAVFSNLARLSISSFEAVPLDCRYALNVSRPVHRDKVALLYVLSSAFKLLKPFLHCSQEYGLSSMCSSMLPSHWICFCSVHRDMFYLQNVLSSAFKWLKSFLHCSQGYGFSPVCALQGFQVTEFVFAVFTGIWFIFRMCSQVLSNG